jgi:uridine phosphorylase
MDISCSRIDFGSVTTTFVVVCATGVGCATVVVCVTVFSWLKVDQFMFMVFG